MFNIRKHALMFAAVIALAFFGTTTAQADCSYRAIAADSGTHATGVGCGSTMERARKNAIKDCQDNGGGSCGKTTAEGGSWCFVARVCSARGVEIDVYTAASSQWAKEADVMLMSKAERDVAAGVRFTCEFLARTGVCR